MLKTVGSCSLLPYTIKEMDINISIHNFCYSVCLHNVVLINMWNLKFLSRQCHCLMSREGNSGSMVVNSLWSHGHEKLQLSLRNGIFLHILFSDSESKVLDECILGQLFSCHMSYEPDMPVRHDIYELGKLARLSAKHQLE